MRYWILFLTLLGSPAYSEITKFQLEAKRMPFQRDAYFPDQNYWQYHLDLLWDVKYQRFFWENDIQAQTFHDAFKEVAWEYKIGFKIIPEIDVLWHHRSQHKLEAYAPKFPVRDSFGIRIDFLK